MIIQADIAFRYCFFIFIPSVNGSGILLKSMNDMQRFMNYVR